MFKFLRKYNKWILVVGGTLLLITFLIPFAFEQLGAIAARRGQTWATVGPDRRKVTAGELAEVQRELKVVQYWPLYPGPGVIEQPEHWYLLVREAGTAGLIEAPGAIEFDETMASLDAQRLVAGMFSGESPDFVRRTLARWNGVRRMIDLYMDGNKFSDARLRQEARRSLHAVSAQVVVIRASEPSEPREFGEEELAAQLEKYGDVAAGAGEMGFGYRLPDRVKLEWLKVPADAVRSMLEKSDQMNPVALRKHWRMHPELGEVVAGEEVPEKVRNDLLDHLTREKLDEIAKFANDELRISQRGLEARDGYLVLPEGWEGPPLPDLALRIQDRYAIELPEYHAAGDTWLAAEDIPKLPGGIAMATTDKFGRTPTTLSAIIRALKEFGGTAAMPVQHGVAGPPLRGPDRSVYLFRVIDTDPSRAPRSVDEVRDRIVADLAKLAHYDEIAAQAEAIRQDAVARGLAAVAVDHETRVQPAGRIAILDLNSLRSQIQIGMVPTPMPSSLPVIGPDEEAVAAIIDHAMSLPQVTPVTELTEEERTIVVPARDKLSLLVVRLTANYPLTREVYSTEASRNLIQLPLVLEEIGDQDPAGTTFGILALAGRHNFALASGAPLVREEEGEDAGEAEEPEKAAGAEASEKAEAGLAGAR